MTVPYSARVSAFRKPVRLALALVVIVGATGAGGGDLDVTQVPRVLLALAVILVTAKLSGAAFERLRLPPVLGELVAGVVLGNLPLAGVHAFAPLLADPVIHVLAELGVILLLFEVGLESSVPEMRRVGTSAFLVALVGVITPMALGFGVAVWMLPEESWHAHVFIGAILTATSVGISARVLKDLGELASFEGRIILGAAVIDDVLALVVLAVVKGVVAGGSSGQGVGAAFVLVIVAKAMGFLGGAILLGGKLSKVVFRVANAAYVPGAFLSMALALCFAGAYLAYLVGLAPIVGAFAVGLVLDHVTYQPLATRDGHGLEELVHPIAAFLVPVFFVVTGAHVDLAVLTNPKILGFAGLLTAAALVGKQACALATREPGLDRLAIGIGMIPRGEVGLIFAATGAATLLPDGRPVVGPSTYAAVVIMVMVSTLITPPLLTWRLGRRRAGAV
jgi:Kef-type K+ transport system membrane component KefB